MINLTFTINREPIRITIENKRIKYFDRKWSEGVDFMPKNTDLIKHLLVNQRRFPQAREIVAWINEANSGQMLRDYEAAQTDEQLAEIVRLDAISKGLIEAK